MSVSIDPKMPPNFVYLFFFLFEDESDFVDGVLLELFVLDEFEGDVVVELGIGREWSTLSILVLGVLLFIGNELIFKSITI